MTGSVQARRCGIALHLLSFVALLFLALCKPLFGANPALVYDEELLVTAGEVVPQGFLECPLWVLAPEVLPYQGLYQDGLAIATMLT